MKSLSSSTKPRKLGRKSKDSLHPMWAWFLHTTHTPNSRQSWQSKAKLDSPTLPLYSYLPCVVQIHLVWREIFLQNLNQRTKLRVIWSEGAWQVKGHHGQLRGRHTWRTIHLGSKQPLSLLDKTHTHNQAHSTHEDGNTHHILFISYAYIMMYVRRFLSKWFWYFDANWQHFDVHLFRLTSGCQHNAQFQLQRSLFALLWLLDLTLSIYWTKTIA